MDAKVLKMERRIQKIKEELVALEDLRPGSLSKQYNVCGTPGCRCKTDPSKRHGPYHQLSWTRKGENTTRFIRKGYVSQVQRQVRNYRRLQSLVEEWIDLSAQICDLRLQQVRRS